jgi:hypothetical protein
MTNEKVVGASSLPTIDRGTGARTKMSRKRFLAFIMVGLMIVSAVSMIAPSMLNNSQDDGNDQPAQVSWNPGGAREAIYKIDHLFENYRKAVNFTKAAHGGAGKQHQEVYLGHHSQTLMGNNDWLNTSGVNSPRGATYGEMTLRNNYPYVFYWNPCPSGKLTPTIPVGLATWAPYRITAVVKNDTALRTGYQDSQRNVPFLPYWGHGVAGKGGYINVSLYGTYLTLAEVNALRAGTHYGNWFYGMPITTTPMGSTNDGYYFELHGTYQLSRNALITFLNWSGVGDARTWFNATKGVAQTSGLQKWWRAWMWENYSEIPGKGGAGGGGAPYWNNLVNNGNIYTCYEFDMAGSAGLYVSLAMDPMSKNGSTANSLAIRAYMMGWGPDAALIRMLEASGICGSFGTSGSGYWDNRAGFANYGEDVYLNSSIRESMANSTWREVTTYTMLGWEDDANDVWSSGYMIPLGAHPDYIPNSASNAAYPSPMSKYQEGVGAIDVYTLDQTKSMNWNGPGSENFNTNASVCLVAPQVRNLTAYEAIIVDLNVLDGTNHSWLAYKEAKFGGQTMAMQPYKAAAGLVAGRTTTIEFNSKLYWGTVKLGKGCYPQAACLAGYNSATKILNLSGGATGMAMPMVRNTDYWGGNPNQPSVIYTRSQPAIQLDVSAVHHYVVTLASGPYMTNTNYQVKAIPVNATGWIPRANNSAYGVGAFIVNQTVLFSTNNAGSTFPGGATQTFSIAGDGNITTTVRFATVSSNTFVNATDQMFTYIAAETPTGSAGPIVVMVPEFATVLIPIVGMMAIFFVFRSRKKKHEE